MVIPNSSLSFCLLALLVLSPLVTCARHRVVPQRSVLTMVRLRLLDWFNSARLLREDTPPLMSNSTLDYSAQKWAYKMTRTGFKVSDTNFGEIIGSSFSELNSQSTLLVELKSFWNNWNINGSEYLANETDHDPSSIIDEGRKRDAAAFAQVVWKNSTQIGCGIAVAAMGSEPAMPDDYVYYLVCHFYPAGNKPGKYKENIGQLLPAVETTPATAADTTTDRNSNTPTNKVMRNSANDAINVLVDVATTSKEANSSYDHQNTDDQDSSGRLVQCCCTIYTIIFIASM